MTAPSKTNLAQILNNAVPIGDLEGIKGIIRNRDINHLYNGKTIIHLFMDHMDSKNVKINEKLTVKKDQPYKWTNAAKLFHCLREVVGSCINFVNLNILDETRNTPITILLKKKFHDDKALKKVILEYFSKSTIFINYEMKLDDKETVTVRDVFTENAPYIHIPTPAIPEIYEKLITAVQKCDSKTIMPIVRNYDINQLFDGGKTLIHLFMENMDNENIETNWPKQPTSNEENKYKDSYASKLLQCLQEVLHRPNSPININILDDNNDTPLTILLNKDKVCDKIKKDAFEYFIRENVLINYDLVTKGNHSVRKVFETKAPGIIIPSIIESACMNGDQKALKGFLTDKKVTSAINEEGPLLAILVYQICKNKDYLKYQQCLDSLLKIESITKDVHQVHDDNHGTIKLAEIFYRKDVIMKLLNVSLFIGLGKSVAHSMPGCCSIYSLCERIKSCFEPTEFSLQSINPDIIEEHLNTCITTFPNLSDRDENYSIRFNYESFNRLEYNEMTLCHHLIRDPDLERLLQHPLIHSFIFIRWQQFNQYFYISLTLNAIFFFLAILYFTFCNGWYSVPWEYLILAILFLAIVLINAILNWQFKTTILVWLLFLLSLIDNHFSHPHYKFLIFLSAAGLLLCLKDASHFNLSKYVYVFQRVMINFLQLLTFYAICIIGFAFAFYKNAHDLMNDPSRNSANETFNSNANISYELSFDTAPMAVLKTIVMSTGEFDAAEVDLMKNFIFILFFVTFIISISIVLSNLLISMAVNETKEILKRADLVYFIFKVKYMSSKECLTKKLHYIFKYCPILLRLIYRPGSNRSMTVYTNKILSNNSISINDDNKKKLCIRMIKNDVMPQTFKAFLTELCRLISHPCRDMRDDIQLTEVNSQSRPQRENQPETNASSTADDKKKLVTENFELSKELLLIIQEAKKIALKNPTVETTQPTPTASVNPVRYIGQGKSKLNLNSIQNTNLWDPDKKTLKSGSFKENKQKFSQYEGQKEESSALAIAAIVLGSISKPKDWKQSSINSIIVEGIKYYKDWKAKPNPSGTNVIPKPRDRPINITMFKQQFSISCVDKFEDSDELIQNLTRENSKDIHGVLDVDGTFYGILKIDGIYYIFESSMGECAGIKESIELNQIRGKIANSQIVYYEIEVIKLSDKFCSRCARKINSKQSKPVSCDGTCDKVFHITCVRIPEEEYEKIVVQQSKKWFCSECQANSEVVDARIADTSVSNREEFDSWSSDEKITEILRTVRSNEIKMTEFIQLKAHQKVLEKKFHKAQSEMELLKRKMKISKKV